MFDKLNIFINQGVKKEESSKNFLIEIFSNKYEIAIITFWIYFSGVLYQFLKLTWIFNNKLMIWNLVFFSFSNSINDFLIIFWYSLIIFILTFFIVFLPNLIFNEVLFLRNRSKIFLIIWFWIVFICIWLLIFNVTNNYSNYYIYIPYFISLVLTIIFFIKNLNFKTYFYSLLLSFYLYWFIIMLISWVKYYWCENIRDNIAEKNCFLLEYKNDKYWFTWNWDIYKLDEFRSFFTSDYFKNQTSSWKTN